MNRKNYKYLNQKNDESDDRGVKSKREAETPGVTNNYFYSNFLTLELYTVMCVPSPLTDRRH